MRPYSMKEEIMKCPACGKELRQMVVGGVTVDVCEGGCGGIWFDNYELKKFDEPHEAAGEELLDIKRNENIRVDHAAKRKCPLCKNMPMQRHFSSVKQEVSVDECPNCGGFWLDAGELAGIRQLYGSEEEGVKAAEEYFQDVFGKELAAMKAESDENIRKARRVANMFRFICPTNYIPGKQDWGAF